MQKWRLLLGLVLVAGVVVRDSRGEGGDQPSPSDPQGFKQPASDPQGVNQLPSDPQASEQAPRPKGSDQPQAMQGVGQTMQGVLDQAMQGVGHPPQPQVPDSHQSHILGGEGQCSAEDEVSFTVANCSLCQSG